MDKAELEKQLNAAYQAREKTMISQEYKIGSRYNRRADLDKIQAVIKDLESKLANGNFNSGNGNSRRVILIDR